MYYNINNNYKSKILKEKSINVKVGAMKPQKVKVILKQLPNGSYEVVSGVAFCHITGDKSPSAMRDGMNLTTKYFNNKKLAERFFNSLK